MEYEKVIYRVHAIQRMFERNITEEDVSMALKTGETVEIYPDDFPYPSQLIMAWVNGKPLHVVVAYNETEHMSIIITVYQPDPDLWESGFRRRKE